MAQSTNPHKIGKRIPITAEQRTELIRRYTEDGESKDALAEAYGLKYDSVKWILQAVGARQRPRAPKRPAKVQLTVPDPEFMTKGQCIGADPALFFPAKGENATAAKALCAGCPVITECLEWALVYREEGIWGGTGGADRRLIRAERKAAEKQMQAAS